MELRVFTEPQQGATYGQQLTVARAAEERGFGAFFRSDHLLAIGGSEGLPGPTDSWLTLAALARETTSLRLGTLVTSATFRFPGPLAIAVAQVDEMSGGRVELGLGAGWFEAEHTAYGVPFPDVAERFDRFEEQLAVITGLWRTPDGETFSHPGRFYPVVDSPALPKPVQRPHPPVVVGGQGRTRTPALAARYAAEYNVAFTGEDRIAAAFDRVRAACGSIGRDPADLVLSVAQTVCCGVDDAEVARRAAVIGRSVEDLREHSFIGTPEEVTERIGRLADLGVTRVYLQVLDLDDVAQLDLVASRVMPALATA